MLKQLHPFSWMLFLGFMLQNCNTSTNSPSPTPAPTTSLGFSAEIDGTFFTTSNYYYRKLAAGGVYIYAYYPSTTDLAFEFTIDTLKVRDTFYIGKPGIIAAFYTQNTGNGKALYYGTSGNMVLTAYSSSAAKISASFSFSGQNSVTSNIVGTFTQGLITGAPLAK